MSSQNPKPPQDPEIADPGNDGGISETIKRAISTGVRGFMRSEENLRNLAGDIWNSDKVEAVGNTISNIRTEVVTIFGREFVKYLDRINLTDEVVKVLTAISLEVKTEIRFIPNDERLVTPDVKASVKLSRTNKKRKPKRGAKKNSKKKD
jgi:hypothetical protein